MQATVGRGFQNGASHSMVVVFIVIIFPVLADVRYESFPVCQSTVIYMIHDRRFNMSRSRWATECKHTECTLDGHRWDQNSAASSRTGDEELFAQRDKAIHVCADALVSPVETLDGSIPRQSSLDVTSADFVREGALVEALHALPQRSATKGCPISSICPQARATVRQSTQPRMGDSSTPCSDIHEEAAAVCQAF